MLIFYLLLSLFFLIGIIFDIFAYIMSDKSTKNI